VLGQCIEKGGIADVGQPDDPDTQTHRNTVYAAPRMPWPMILPTIAFPDAEGIDGIRLVSNRHGGCPRKIRRDPPQSREPERTGRASHGRKACSPRKRERS